MIEDNRPPWVPYYPAKLLGALSGMTSDQQLIYQVVLLRIYETWAPLKDTVEALARRCAMNKRRAADALDALFRAGKLLRVPDGIMNPFAAEVMAEAEAVRHRRSGASTAAARGKWKSPKNNKKRHERLAEARSLGQHTPEQWAALIKFCGPRCLKCGNEKPLVKDHITPIYQGGSDAIENIQPLCGPCNSAKGPETRDYRPPGWKSIIKTKESACEAPAKRLETPAQLQLQVQEEPTPSGVGVPRPPRKTFLDPDWTPSLDDLAYAANHGFARRDVTDKIAPAFKDHHASHGNAMVNWSAAWRTWVRNEVDFRSRNSRRGGGPINGSNRSNVTGDPKGRGGGEGFTDYALACARAAGDEGPDGASGPA